MKKLLIVLAIAATASGCATQGTNTADYKKNSPLVVKNEVQTSEPYSQVWDKLVRELSKSYFVINNIDKESRIINLSFSSTTPSDYIDCGKSHRTYVQGDKVETFDYEAADKATFKIATPKQEHPAFSNYVLVQREPNLEGRTNVYLAPLEADKNRTLVTVNTRYILTVNIKGQAYAQHISGNVFNRGQVWNEAMTIPFNTNKTGEKEGVTCFSKGVLENEILKLVDRTM